MVNAKIRLIIFFADKDKEALYSQQKQDWKLTEQLNWTEWSSGFPYFLQFKCEFGNKELMIWATVRGSSQEELPMSKVRGGGQEEQPYVQGAVVVRAQKGREELLHVQGQEGWLWGDTPHPR